MSDVRVVALVGGHVQRVGVLPGRVRVVLEGAADDVRAVLAELSGPRAPGSVIGVETRDEPVQAVSGFTVG